MTEQNNYNNKQPSQELFNLLVELKITISKLKGLYKTIDKKALEEGFSIEEIYELANITEIETKSSAAAAVPTITNTTTNISNEENEETKYFQRYFQHFQ
jgi:hypothetical protein